MNQLTEDKVEAMRSWLKKSETGLVDSNIDALCDLAQQTLLMKKHPMLTFEAFVACPHGCQNGYTYDADGCYPNPCPIHGKCECRGGKLSHENCEAKK